MDNTVVENLPSSTFSSIVADHSAEQAPLDLPNHENMEPKYDISAEESKCIIEVIAATGKFWHDWEVLRSLLSSQLKQALEEYPESQMVGGDGPQLSSLSGETYAELATRLEEALLSFSDGPPFTLQRLCEILLSPKSTYKTLSKLALALEKNLLVTSTVTRSTEPYPTELLQKSAESEKGSSEPQVHHSSPTPNEPQVHQSSPTPNGVEALAGDADEEMVEAEADEEAVNSDMDVQEDNASEKSESTSAVAADSDPLTNNEEHGSTAA
ncbi:Protein phosphatase 4 core regulatory subunit R2 protein [Dioscorea alata]|uniref:Protein phosphatase 4 core regulatory subunit R2 protein n=1 Tax=Dioscorea alata TaxID=55571 RepID=A0ACB7VRE4_DIOAL|nr:Protein phosphatase 4 core regulatory subunit R2 protein [Dioscorea alata]